MIDAFTRPRARRHCRPGRRLAALLAAAALASNPAADAQSAPAPVTLLNVSYDPTREFYRELNEAFAEHWREQGGGEVRVNQSHGGSGAQARAVIEGLRAHVVSLATQVDIDAIVTLSGRIDPGWRERLANHSAPYTSTVVFLVRAGNPKGIVDWGDLVRHDVAVITPNPKTSGGARWNFLAAWAWAATEFGGDEERVLDYLRRIYGNVPMLDTAARGSMTTFVQRRLGDVLIAWENEAHLALASFGADAFEVVVPSLSVLAAPPVALVDRNAAADGTTEVAHAYLEFLYGPTGQRLAAKHHFRPLYPEHAVPEDLRRFEDLALVSIDDPLFGGWAAVQAKHFAEGGTFDQIFGR